MPDRPHIVILDGHTANPGDLDWTPFEQLGRVDVHPRTPADAVADRLAGATAALTNKVPITADLLEKTPSLKYVGVLATGYNVVDVEAAKERGVVVTNVAGYSTESTAQHAFALLLALANGVESRSRDVAERWPRCPDFTYFEDRVPVELAGLTCGVVGFGEIGRAFCRRAKAFGMTVLAHTANPDKHRAAAAGIGVEFVALDDLLRQSDAVSLHCPLTPDTDKLVDAAAIETMKPTAFLINAGRGQLVDEPALAAALNENRLGGAGLDVLSSEPPAADNPLLHAKNCVVTPHCAFATAASRRRLIAEAAANLRAFLAGERRNVVS